MTEETEKTDADTEAVGSDTETSEEASSAAGSDGKAAALPEEKKVGLEPVKCRKRIRITWLLIRKCPEKCRRKMVEVDISLPYIDYESTACENVNYTDREARK